MGGNTPKTIDEYIASAPEAVQPVLQRLRDTIREEAPEATEAIKYQLPTFVWNGNLVHFGAFKKHIGLYPTPSATESFSAELAGFKTSKGAIQFPLDQPLPWDLVRRIVRFRVEENQRKKRKE